MKPRYQVVCRGWFDADGARVHTDVRVLTPGDPGAPVSDGICLLCRDVFLARLPKKEEVR